MTEAGQFRLPIDQIRQATDRQSVIFQPESPAEEFRCKRPSEDMKHKMAISFREKYFHLPYFQGMLPTLYLLPYINVKNQIF